MASRPPKRRRLTPPASDDESTSRPNHAKVQKAFFKNAANWDLEQNYETKARKGKKKDRDTGRLPIKTSDGVLRHVEVEEEDNSDGDWLDNDGDGDGDEAPSPEAADSAHEEPQIPEAEQILRAKEELAKIALKLNEDPEEHPGCFKALAQVGQSRIVAIQKLTLVTQMAVYRDVIPGYRIRPISEQAAGEKLSKEVRRLQSYEQSLIAGYQAYIKQLMGLAKGGRPTAGKNSRDLARVAITCACTLLTSVPHFNFRGELLRILVGKLSTRNVDESFVKCRETLESLFREDDEGRVSMEAVSLLSKMMKARDYQIHESVLNTFLYLRLLSEFSGKASQDNVDQPNGFSANGKRLKMKKVFRTKRERKSLKEQKALEKDMAQADALVSHEERDKMQSETLKQVFATYFRILKLRLPHLMGAVLEGLAKYAHLINQDFFGDLLEALKDLIRHSEEDKRKEVQGLEEKEDEGDDDDDDEMRNPSREALLCTTTAFALLAGQDAHNARADLHLDLSFFTTHLFRSILPLSVNPDIELRANSLRLADPDDPAAVAAAGGSRSAKVNLQTTTVLLIRCLTAILLPSYNIRSVPPLRLAAFTKQLMAASLHVPEKSCQAIVALLHDVSHTHGKKISALWNTEERKGDGTFNPLSETVEGSNPFATTAWENELLRRHFCPKVREGVKALEKSLSTA